MKTRQHPIRFVLFIDGLLLLILAVAMAVPMIVDLSMGNPDWLVFASSAAVTIFTGGILTFTCSSRREARLDHRAGYLLTASAWIIVCIFGALPLFFSSLHLSFADAFFETMSGLTTTGSTVISGLDHLPAGLLLWRALLQWIGGVGIVVMAIVLLPALRIGGMQLFQSESSDISGKPVPRLLHMAVLTIVAYVVLSVICAVAYALAGMGVFDAICSAMATLATGGFSTKDASFGYYHSVPIEVVGIVFMTAGALPLIWYTQLLTHGHRALAQERQVPTFLAILSASILTVTLWNVSENGMTFAHALRLSAFNVTSVLTDTGFATADFSKWGSFAVGVFFVLYLIGGCAGSTSGGIKTFRWQILFSGVLRQLRETISPHRVLLMRYADRVIEDETAHAVRNFFFMYLITLLVLSLLVMMTGLDFLSSASAVAQAMANAGPGLGPIVGPSTTFGSLSDAAKWLLSAAMLLGRLELMTVYVLFLPGYWRT